MKASRVISGELRLGQLWRTTLEILLENVGGQRGYFVYRDQGALWIEARCEAGVSIPPMTSPIAVEVEDRAPLPVSVINAATYTVAATIDVTPIPLPPVLLNGKRLFHSSATPDLARDQWISCATCHFNGEMDGRTWFFPDGPRNTTSLLGTSCRCRMLQNSRPLFTGTR